MTCHALVLSPDTWHCTTKHGEVQRREIFYTILKDMSTTQICIWKTCTVQPQPGGICKDMYSVSAEVLAPALFRWRNCFEFLLDAKLELFRCTVELKQEYMRLSFSTLLPISVFWVNINSTESQNSWDWKGPQKMVEYNPPTKAGIL